jgi:DNA replication ATP-dependent helicase Dna2
VIVNFRNKLNKEKFNAMNIWCLEADYMEVVNRYLLSSIADFIFKNFPNKPYILGVSQPEFIENKTLNNLVDNIKELNEEKKIIIKNALAAQNYYLIQGPPGTGKTSYILKYLTRILFCHTNENILLLAYTNRAVDEICNNIKQITNDYSEFDFIRLGNKESSEHTDKLLSHLPINILPDKVNKCRCFAATVATANASPELFQIKNFDTIIIDEAAQILESSIVGLLSKANRFIMIGDEKQLPPISIVAENYLKINNEQLNSIDINYLGDSLFERLLRICISKNYSAYSLLNMQSRMSPQIMNLANNLFYNNQLKINPKINNSSQLNFLNENTDCYYIDTPLESNAKINHHQIKIILKLIQLIKNEYNESITQSTIGIISP